VSRIHFSAKPKTTLLSAKTGRKDKFRNHQRRYLL
jgi:hypothetical protein